MKLSTVLAVAAVLVFVAGLVLVGRHPKTVAAAPREGSSLAAAATQVRAGEPPSVRRWAVERQLSARHRPHLHSCTDNNWLTTLKPAERWIFRRESSLNPASREPSTGAYGLGQLLPSTYANLGLPMTASPCQQIAAARAYAAERYGSYANARRFWEVHSWW